MSCFGDSPPNIVVFLLDDMRFDQVEYLTETESRLASESVVFSRAYVTTPMCCPERASFLSGGWYAHQTGVRTNDAPDGGATQFTDKRTLAVRLQEAGYATALFGKYLNEYDQLGAYVPPGWSDWGGTYESNPWNSFDVKVGSSTADAPGIAVDKHFPGYIEDWETVSAKAFLDAHPDDPFFLYLPYLAPHNPHVPAPADLGEFLTFQYRGRAYEEADISDKPAWMQQEPLLDAAGVAALDQNNVERLQSLLSVDRSIAAIIDTIRKRPGGENTVFILTSDNGQMWSEHRLVGKGVGYEESVRIPLLVSHPGLASGVRNGLVASNLDLASTVQQLAGLAAEGEGVSLVPALCDGTDVGRSSILLQAWPWDSPGWSGFVTPTWKYLETETGERELYALDADPYEENNVAATHSEVADSLAAQLTTVRGLQITSRTLPHAIAGEEYSHQLQHWGGVDPIAWTLVRDEFPEGLSLGLDGVVSGTPKRAGSNEVTVQARDAGTSPYDGRPQTMTLRLTLTIDVAAPRKDAAGGGEACGCAVPREERGTTLPGALIALATMFWRRRRGTLAG